MNTLLILVIGACIIGGLFLLVFHMRKKARESLEREQERRLAVAAPGTHVGAIKQSVHRREKRVDVNSVKNKNRVITKGDNNAIWARNEPATELDEKDWDRTLATGLKTVYLSAKYGVPVMRKTGGGSIINTGSVHSLVSFPGHTAYDAAKAGLLGLTRVLALDFGPDVRVNAVLPGAILTPLWNKLGVPKKMHKQFAEMVPARRLGQPEVIAHAVLFLASEEASFITGTSLVVDGGMLARTM